MKEIRLADGRMIRLREMTRLDRFPGGKGRCPANCEVVIGGPLVATESFRTVTNALIERYGTTAILALDGDLVAAFVDFHPTWCPNFALCFDELIEQAMAHLGEIRNPPACEDPALHIRCLTVRREYRGNHLSLALLDYLKDWARAHGWKKIVASGCIFPGRAQFQWLVSPKPPRPIWERAGFVAQDYPALGLLAVSDRDGARQALEWYKSDEFPKDVPRDVDPEDPKWPAIFTGYTMVCEL